MIDGIIDRMSKSELKSFLLRLCEKDEMLLMALKGLEGGIDVNDYKFRLAKAIGDPIYWSSYVDDYEDVANNKILNILAEVDAAAAKNKNSHKAIIELLDWLLDIINDGYINSIEGLIIESVLEAINILTNIAIADKTYRQDIINILLEYYDGFEYNIEDEIVEAIAAIFKKMSSSEALSIANMESIINSDAIEEALIKAERLDILDLLDD